MESSDPIVRRLDPSVVRQLNESIRAAQRSVRARVKGEPRAQDFNGGNRWVIADDFLTGFSHLRLSEGTTLACVYSAWEEERQSRLVVCKLPAHSRVRHPLGQGESLPPIPDGLKNLEMRAFFRQDKQPDQLPDWIEWEVWRAIEDDGSPEAVFERSLLYRWVGELLNFGHGVYWPRYHIIAELSDWATRFIEHAKAVVRSRPKVIELPLDWNPLIVHRVPAGHPLADLPKFGESREKLQGEVFSVVTFHSGTSYVQECIYRHKDWFVGKEFVCSEMDDVVEGGRGYLV